VSGRRAINGLSLVTVGTVFAPVTIITVILEIPITVTRVRAARTVAVTTTVAVVVAIPVTALILSRRIVASAAARRRGTAATGRAATTTTVAVTARLKSPGGRGGSAGPLDLQHVITPDSLVVHFMISVVGITTILVLNKSKAGPC
jgi:hypothetical protein